MLHGWHRGTGVMPWRCQAGSRLCWEGSKPSGVTYGVKSSDTNRHQGGSCAPIHTYLHVTFSVRQQWLRGASPSSCDNHAILFFSNQPHHSCIQWEPFFYPECLIIRNHKNEAEIACLDPYFLLWKMRPRNGIIFFGYWVKLRWKRRKGSYTH